jgi:hypothetical protein
MNPSLNRNRGKNFERSVAKLLGGKRMGIMGKVDVEHPLFSIECKSRKSFVACEWMDQAKRNCSDTKSPMLVVHVRGKRHNADLVILTLQDFKNIYGWIK